jgi:hypothetical protein
MAPHFTASRYVNAEKVGDGGAVLTAFGPNWSRRLREVNRQYNPHNVFHLNQNIKP